MIIDLPEQDTHSEDLDDFLEHHGVKGMKWGIRHDPGHEGQSAKSKKIAKLDAEFEKVDVKKWMAISNAAADKMNNGEIDRINNMPKFKAAHDFNHDSPLRREYYKEYQTTYLKHLQAAADSYGTNASGTKKYHIIGGEEPGEWAITLDDVKHAADAPMLVRLTFDKNGYVTAITPDAPMAHAAEAFMEEFVVAYEGVTLEHHGVKGMKWGEHHVKGDDGKRSAGIATKRFVSPAARAAAKRVRGTRSSDVKHLSDEELQSKLRRLNMERQYKSLAGKGADKATAEFVSGVSKDVAREVVKKALSATVIGFLANRGVKAFVGNTAKKAAKLTPPGASFG